jgi:hypothetical protein
MHNLRLRANRLEGLSHAAKVANAVVDDGDQGKSWVHDSEFRVHGSTAEQFNLQGSTFSVGTTKLETVNRELRTFNRRNSG